MSRVLVVAGDRVGTRMASPGIRASRVALELSRRHDVLLVAPALPDIDLADIEVAVSRPDDGRRLGALARGADAVVAQRLPAATMLQLARRDVRTVYDLYASSPFERRVFEGTRLPSLRRRARARTFDLLDEIALESGGAFLCAGERQRAVWQERLARLGRDAAVVLVPFGIEELPPRSSGPVLKGVVPGIGPDDHVLLWGGGIWEWLDPLTPIRAVARLAEQRDDVRLVFLGLRPPNPEVDAGTMASRAVALADELGLRDRGVFFHVGWTPYDERGAYLLEATLGVSAHFDHEETRYSFRTRLVDYLWAGLPIVTTRGDELGDAVGELGLGRVVDFEDVDGWVDAIAELVDDPEKRHAATDRIAAFRERLRWSRVVEPLLALLETPTVAPNPGIRTARRAAEHYALRAGLAAAGRVLPRRVL